MSLTATCVWHVHADLVLALDAQLGPPVDSYVNGTQTWLTEDGPGGVALEWRLHPVAGYRPPAGLSHYDLWEQVVGALSAGAEAAALQLGTEHRELSSLWEGLECFPAYGDDVEPAPLAAAAVIELVLAGLRQRELQFHQEFVAGLELGAALDADFSHQPLCQNRFDRRRDQKRLNAHVRQPQRHSGRIVGM